MTVEIEFSLPNTRVAGHWEVEMSKQIESNRGFPISDIERELQGTTLFVRIETTLPDTAVENMVSDIENHIPAGSNHVETREL